MEKNKRVTLGLKYLLDKLVAAIALLITLPIFVIIALILKFQREDIFYLQKRLGQYGDEFRVIKFTTMPKGSEKFGLITTSHDSRPTKFGKFLRKTKLNEFPQLINILKGDMSFIGPRPIIKSQMEESLTSSEIREYYMMRSGITGMASLIFHHEDRLLSDVEDPKTYYNTTLMPRKKNLEKKYAENWSLLLDLKILYYTIAILIWDILGVDRDMHVKFNILAADDI